MLSRVSLPNVRDEMNAKLNAIVSGISTKIKEQEEERVAQDKENLALRAALQVLEAFAFLDFGSSSSWECTISFCFRDQRAEPNDIVEFWSRPCFEPVLSCFAQNVGDQLCALALVRFNARSSATQ